ncbi:hypothetical protein A3E73_01415 [Candidatus Beckwithbacteria bacterium RIFCSPHIGHO2_12_FULL_47_17]|uniref:PsbP C-terminal domain-containing protein n=1 Tax=Candidatus Beckwithbacteria bacterium RIFCSPHIGHO2_12_FULL_47_17 TaxID=1797460 RepID=A0A1F5DJJ8_9BACT|nr:MAG: hypothetical protein A3E73_01415 [Candidatus Beckwithbacteria bacterium RIFCSPHIGHO2_12_FULL_47_17]
MRVIIGSLLIIVLIILSLLIGRGPKLLNDLQPTPPPQLAISFVGWQDVVNKEYGYRLKMPHDWSALQIAGEPAYPQRMKLVNVKPEEQTKPHVGIVITAFPFKNQDLNAFPDIAALIDEGREPRRLTMAGSPAVFVDNLGDSGEEFAVFISHKDYLYRFDWTGTHPDVRKQYQDVGLKIMASLKFL